jgi:hypothetical protein
MQHAEHLGPRTEHDDLNAEHVALRVKHYDAAKSQGLLLVRIDPKTIRATKQRSAMGPRRRGNGSVAPDLSIGAHYRPPRNACTSIRSRSTSAAHLS